MNITIEREQLDLIHRALATYLHIWTQENYGEEPQQLRDARDALCAIEDSTGHRIYEHLRAQVADALLESIEDCLGRLQTERLSKMSWVSDEDELRTMPIDLAKMLEICPELQPRIEAAERSITLLTAAFEGDSEVTP